MAAIGQVIEAITVDSHQAGFRARKKAGKYDQNQQRDIQTA
jgi:hypothetical protein